MNEEFNAILRRLIDEKFSDLSKEWRDAFFEWSIGGGTKEESIEKCKQLFYRAILERGKKD